jgi:cytochrome c-type biogenesis protein CcsB
VTLVVFACHVLALVARGFAAHRPPWGNMYEFTLMITGAAVAAWLVVLWRTRARAMGVYVMMPITVLVFLAGTVLYTQAAPLLPVLNSYWLVIHVAAVSLTSGVLMLSGVASAVYLVRDRRERRVAAGLIDPDETPTRLPSLDKLDRIAYRSAIAAFPFYTFAIIAGALWAEVSWGSYWSWDPKETVALVTWIIYAGYLHARATAGWRGRPAAWISVVGLASIIFNLFFVNMVISGLHSYAGLN